MDSAPIKSSNMKRKLDSNMTKGSAKKHIKEGAEKKYVLKDMKKFELIKYCEELLKEKDILIKQRAEQEADLLVASKKIEDLKSNQKDYYGCVSCDYVAYCIHDFTEHTHEHEESIGSESIKTEFPCYHCDQIFETRFSVMTHTKIDHREKVQHCYNYIEDSCTFGENCWYLHDNQHKESCISMKCTFCDQSFKSKSKQMKHMKSKHIETVKMCRNEDENCKFGSAKCWFLHKENIEEAFKKKKNEIVSEHSNNAII